MLWIDRLKRAMQAGHASFANSPRRSRPFTLRRRLLFESLEPRLTLAAAGLVPVGTQPTGTLSGKIVFTSPGHGWEWDSVDDRYETDDRGDFNEVLEPLGTQDQLTYYADYLHRAGATVVPMRPIGRQINEVVLDNDSPGVTFSPTGWSNSVSTRYYDEDYGSALDATPYRFANTVTGAATATVNYTPNIPSAGFYPVYTWVLYGPDRTVQTYRVNHTGGATDVSVDHSKVGSGWVYLGTYHFNAGSSSTLGSVQITNKAPATGKVVIADAIRFGNGMGDYVVAGASGVSGYPREDEVSLLWIARMTGVGTSLATAIGAGASNVSAPSNMAEYMFHGSFGETVYIGIHSNGFPDGTARGARGLMTTDLAPRTPHQADLALYLGQQINQDMQDLDGTFENNWYAGSSHTGANLNFGEIDLGADAEMDATIIEVAFHDNLPDAQIMRDPKGRDQIARSMYQGTLQYFATYGAPLAVNTSLPTAPTNVRAVSNASGEVTINWSAGPTSPASVHGAPATGFRIYASSDGFGFDGGTLVAGGGTTSATLSGYDPSLPYYFRVAAVNAGGESKPSEVITVLPSGGAKQVLIVNGFDRFDRFENFRYPYIFTADGLVDRVWSRYNNSFDYVVQVHAAIHAARPGIHVASASNEAVTSGAVNLTDYDTVIWISGEESTADETFNSVEQTKVEQFIAGGGNLFLSGAEIGWDLDRATGPTAADRQFYETTLKANYVSDDAGTYTTTPVAGGIFAGMSNIVFSNGSAFSSLDSQFYNAEFPDVIAPQAGAQVALNYVGGTGGGAAIQVAGAGGRGSIVMFGFPFETITSAARKQDVIDRVFDFFGLAPIVPDNADFNDDNIVDSADYVIWRKNENTTVPPGTLGDANHDGQVDSADYLIWRSQFGTAPGSGAAASALAAVPASAAAPAFAAADAAVEEMSAPQAVGSGDSNESASAARSPLVIAVLADAADKRHVARRSHVAGTPVQPIRVDSDLLTAIDTDASSKRASTLAPGNVDNRPVAVELDAQNVSPTKLCVAWRQFS